MNNIKAVIFDFGGVLIDWNPYHLFRKVMVNDTEIEIFLQEIDFKTWNYEFDKGYSFTKGIEEMCQKYPSRAETIRIFNDRWIETIGGIFDATVDLVKKVKSNGYLVFGLSNWSAEKFAMVRSRYDFFELFDDMAISGIEKAAKPDKRIFKVLLERNSLKASECLFIDDSENNILISRQLGFNGIHYQSSRQLSQELQNRGIL
jgi:2-haloacid dehalogenase